MSKATQVENATVAGRLTQPIVAVHDVPRVGRKLRTPRHAFHVRHRPFQVQPIFIAPVWPGETMKNAQFQMRVVTDPIKNPLIGWWYETYFYYVKLRDLDDRDALTNMIVTNASTSALNTAADVRTYHAGGAPDFVRMCLDRVVNQYFRDEDEDEADSLLDTMPVARVSTQPGWMDSMINDDLVAEDDHELPGENPSLPPHMAGFADHYVAWEKMRSEALTTATFEDWLRTFGLRVPKEDAEELHRPEELRYLRAWSYPTNTVDPADGSPSSAVSWAISEQANKDRFFKEPGFLFGCVVARPKVYFSKQKGNLTAFLNDAYAWLPAVLGTEAYTSVRKFVGGGSGVGPLGVNATDDYWVDLRDLAMYGDQFVNFALTETNAGLVALPTAGLEKKYPSGADIDALFANAAPLNQVRCDGVADFTILSRLEDTSL
jgi:hypothetical protein